LSVFLTKWSIEWNIREMVAWPHSNALPSKAVDREKAIEEAQKIEETKHMLESAGLHIHLGTE
jgi:hypothetical protein